jgi:serine/threonine-protein phosphatase 2A regulatory subunit B'
LLAGSLTLFSEAQRAIERYDEWVRIREIAIANRKASGAEGPLPASLTEPLPERPPPYEDDDLADLSVDLTANGFDPSESFNMEKSLADDVVPVADPGIDKAVTVSAACLIAAHY